MRQGHFVKCIEHFKTVFWAKVVTVHITLLYTLKVLGMNTKRNLSLAAIIRQCMKLCKNTMRSHTGVITDHTLSNGKWCKMSLAEIPEHIHRYVQH